MKLNLNFCKNETNTITEQEKECIKNYIEKDNQELYENKFGENVTEYELYHLSTVSQNLINWYPFNTKDTVLQIGGDLGELTQVFCNNCEKVVTIEPNIEKAKAIAKRYENRENLEIIVGNINDIILEEKFSIITIIGNNPKIKLKDNIQKLERNLKENGKFIIAVDNKFGLRYFMGNPENILNKKFESLIGYNNEPEKIESFTKSSLEQIFNSIGYKYTFYYPLPDYKMPNVIFSEKQKAKYNSIDKYNPYYKENSTIIANEIDVYREILKTDQQMFEFFTNSFLIILEKEKNEELPLYISYNNMRKEKYRLITKISKNVVEKKPVSKEAEEHYNNIKKNIELLQQNNIKTVDYIENGSIKSKYINQENLLNTVLTKSLEENNQQEFENIIEKYIQNLKKNKKVEPEYKDTIFSKYNIQIEDKNILKELYFVENGFWDMTFKNCFYIENELYFFDQEWREKNVPIEYILYRSILYTISLRRYVNIEELFEKYHISKYKNIFEALDNKIQEEIRSNKIWKFYSQNKYIDIDASLQELHNLQIRDNSKQLAIEQLDKEKQELIEEKQKMKIEFEQEKNDMKQKYDELEKLYQEKLYNKIYRKIKSTINRKRK